MGGAQARMHPCRRRKTGSRSGPVHVGAGRWIGRAETPSGVGGGALEKSEEIDELGADLVAGVVGREQRVTANLA